MTDMGMLEIRNHASEVRQDAFYESERCRGLMRTKNVGTLREVLTSAIMDAKKCLNSVADIICDFDMYETTGVIHKEYASHTEAAIGSATRLAFCMYQLLEGKQSRSAMSVDVDSGAVPGIDITCTRTCEGFIHLHFPFALPHAGVNKKVRSDYAYLIRRSMQHCEMLWDREMMTHVYMVFIHNYNSDLPVHQIRDTDNYEEKVVSDAVAEMFIAGGDGPENVRRISMSLPAETASTDVYLVPYAAIGKLLDMYR